VDTETGELISDAQVAEVPYTAFSSKRAKLRAHSRLIVRRVKRKNPDTVSADQDELFTAWRHHAVFVTSSYEMLQAEGQHRDHAIIEQVIATPPPRRWRTCPAASSTPTQPGPCCGPSRTTSPAPPAPSPAPSTPARPPPRSAPT
jgi:hypothetical protein